LKAGAFWELVRGGGTPELGMLLVRRAADGTSEARLGFLLRVALGFGFGAEAAVVEGAYEGTSEILEGLRWTVGAGAGARGALGTSCAAGGVAVREMEASDDFLRNWLFEGDARSCDWLADGRSTGSLEAAGRGRPEGRGRCDGWSMATVAAVSVAVHA
jgi:hypothetical protein